MLVCVAGWQLRPWVWLCSRFQRGGNVAAEAQEASRDTPDFLAAIPWSELAAAQESTPHIFQAFNEAEFTS